MNMQDLYTDYLLSSFGKTTATGLSAMTDGAISHDAVTRFLSGEVMESKQLWTAVKSFVREHEAAEGCLILDDTLIPKPYTDENDLICWHYDHCSGTNVKGINMVSAVYATDQIAIPVAFELVKKTNRYTDDNGKEKRKSEQTKNELFRKMVSVSVKNQLKFMHVLTDSWYTNSENIKHVTGLKKTLIGALKSNTVVALSPADKGAGRWVKLTSLIPEPGIVLQVYLRSVEEPVTICKVVYTNADESVVSQYLISTDNTLSYQQIITLYQKRWNVETYHRSLKQNAQLTKSPTRTETTQNNHLFCSLLAYVKLEQIKIAKAINHYAFKTNLYLNAIKAAYREITQLRQNIRLI